jgi:hypothetical protein
MTLKEARDEVSNARLALFKAEELLNKELQGPTNAEKLASRLRDAGISDKYITVEGIHVTIHLPPNRIFFFNDAVLEDSSDYKWEARLSNTDITFTIRD